MGGFVRMLTGRGLYITMAGVGLFVATVSWRDGDASMAVSGISIVVVMAGLLIEAGRGRRSPHQNRLLWFVLGGLAVLSVCYFFVTLDRNPLLAVAGPVATALTSQVVSRSRSALGRRATTSSYE